MFQIINPVLSNTQNQTGLQYLQEMLPKIINLLLIGGAVIFFFMLLIGGIQWISSGGDKGKLESAKGRITAALIGLLVMFATFAIIKLIEGFFGVNLLNLNLDNVSVGRFSPGPTACLPNSPGCKYFNP